MGSKTQFYRKIIALVSVNMIYTRQIFWIWKKCTCNKNVNGLVFLSRFIAEHYRFVSAFMAFENKILRFSGVVIIYAFYVSTIAHFI